MTVPLYAAWAATLVGSITIGNTLDGWMSDEAKILFSARLRESFASSPSAWIRSINEMFLKLFDRVYARRGTRLEQLIWRGILTSYLILALARLTLFAIRVPPPSTETILITAAAIAVAACLFVQGFYFAVDLQRERGVPAPSRLIQLVRDKRALAMTTCIALGFSITVSVSAQTGHRFGTDTRVLPILSIATILATVCLFLLFQIPDQFFPVSPVRAVVSSFLFMILLGFLFPSTATAAFQGGLSWHIATYIIFNVFADAVSLVETRWLLRKGANVSFFVIGNLLIVDLILSAGIYLILPGIADQDFNVLRQGIGFGGPQPWLGILFWSTFTTSLLFYLFVIGALLARGVYRLIGTINLLDKIFSIATHPARLLAFTMWIVATVVFGAIVLFG